MVENTRVQGAVIKHGGGVTASWLPSPQLKLMHFLMKLIQKHAMVIELDPSGKVVRSLHDPSGLITTSVSSVLDLGDKLLLGSYFAPYIVTVSAEPTS